MTYEQERELIRLRRELRATLMTRGTAEASDLLQRLRRVVDACADTAPSLRGEYERWKLRFELLNQLEPAVSRPAPQRVAEPEPA